MVTPAYFGVFGRGAIWEFPLDANTTRNDATQQLMDLRHDLVVLQLWAVLFLGAAVAFIVGAALTGNATKAMFASFVLASFYWFAQFLWMVARAVQKRRRAQGAVDALKAAELTRDGSHVI